MKRNHNWIKEIKENMDISLIFNNTKLAFKGLVVNRKCHSKKRESHWITPTFTLNYFFKGNIRNLKYIIFTFMSYLFFSVKGIVLSLFTAFIKWMDILKQIWNLLFLSFKEQVPVYIVISSFYFIVLMNGFSKRTHQMDDFELQLCAQTQ